MDDSTLHSNPPDILHRQIRETIGTLSRSIDIMGFALRLDVGRYYRDALRIDHFGDIAERLPDALAAFLVGRTNRF